MAVDAGNLENVVKRVKRLRKHREKTTLEIKEKYSNVSVILPNFTQEQSSQCMSDFNDLMLLKGLEFVTKEIKIQIVCLKKENSDKKLTRG
ncbi:hypothetical protein ACD574_00180 [Campylobacter sp. LH-2024]